MRAKTTRNLPRVVSAGRRVRAGLTWEVAWRVLGALVVQTATDGSAAVCRNAPRRANSAGAISRAARLAVPAPVSRVQCKRHEDAIGIRNIIGKGLAFDEAVFAVECPRRAKV